MNRNTRSTCDGVGSWKFWGLNAREVTFRKTNYLQGRGGLMGPPFFYPYRLWRQYEVAIIPDSSVVYKAVSAAS
jgi:hypothetical protein